MHLRRALSFVPHSIALVVASAGCSLLDWRALEGDGPFGDAGAAEGAPDGTPVLADASAADSASADDAYATAVLADAPLVFLRFEEADGAPAAIDRMGAHSATYPVGASRVAGAVGRGLSSAAGVDVPLAGELPFAARAPFTLEAFVRVEAPKSHFSLGSGDGTSSVELLLGPLVTAELSIYVDRHAPGFYDHGDAVAIVPGRFQHFVGTYDGAVVRMYVDGALVDTTPSSGDMSLASWTAFLSVGAGVTVDEVAFYDHALATVRVLEHCKASGVCP